MAAEMFVSTGFPHHKRNWPMITFEKKGDLPPTVANETEENRFEQIRKLAAERHKKADTDGTRRRDRQTVEDNRLR
jgi:hypothetical protein